MNDAKLIGRLVKRMSRQGFALLTGPFREDIEPIAASIGFNHSGGLTPAQRATVIRSAANAWLWTQGVPEDQIDAICKSHKKE